MQFPTEQSLSDLSQDKFGYKPLARKLLENVFLEMELPNTFGIYGNWGTGKSTFLNALNAEIEKNENSTDVLQIRFEPWKYEYAQSVDLFVSLIREFSKQAKIPEKSKVLEDLGNALVGMSSSILKQLVDKGTLGIVNVEDMRKETDLAALPEISGDPFEQVDWIQQLKSKLDALIKEALTLSKKKKVYIFIDDLDRCSPEHTTSLLEAIKNFLLTDNVLFIFAIDRRVISEMIEQKYGLHSGYGDEYLTKIIQYSLTLPAPSHREILLEIFQEHLIDMPERTREWILEFTNRFAPETRRFKHLIYQLITQAKLAGIDLDKDNDVDTASLFCAIYLKFCFPRLFHVNRRTALENLLIYAKMVNAQNDKHQGDVEDLKNQLGISGSDKKILTALYIHKLPNGQQMMHENRGRLEEMGFKRMVD